MADLTRADYQNDPNVQKLLANVAPQDQAAILDLLVAGGNIAASSGAVTTQRTQTRRDMGVPHQMYKLWNAYFSVVRFPGTVTNPGGVNTLVTWQGGTELRPFSYKIGDPLTTAGFPATFGPNALATAADTNLVTASQTLAGEQLMVHGVSLMPSTTTDAGAWAFLNDSMSVSISMDGDQRKYRLGRPFMIPASGGMYGFPSSVITAFAIGAWSNGVPDIGNFYEFPEPLIWTSSGQTDSNFNLILKLERTVAVEATTTAATSPVTSGIDVGAYVDIVARLHTSQTADRSLNQ
jgi:hypothetical protein